MKCIDLFAGAGGFTEGATRAGAKVVWAANHSPDAVKIHARNHPETEHTCQDLRQADFTQVPDFDLLLASPACQGHSLASQGKRRAKHDSDRSTAWAVVDCLERCLPRAAIIENVPNFKRWKLFPVWQAALDALGYSLDVHTLDAADFGVPQNRSRLIMVAWRGASRPLDLPKRSWKPARSILLDDADVDPCAWTPIASKPDGVQGRVERARARLNDDRYLIHQVTGHSGRSLERPIGTITCARSHWALVDKNHIRALTVRELARAQGFRDDYAIPQTSSLGTRLVGNAIPPPMAEGMVRAVMKAAA